MIDSGYSFDKLRDALQNLSRYEPQWFYRPGEWRSEGLYVNYSKRDDRFEARCQSSITTDITRTLYEKTDRQGLPWLRDNWKFRAYSVGITQTLGARDPIWLFSVSVSEKARSSLRDGGGPSSFLDHVPNEIVDPIACHYIEQFLTQITTQIAAEVDRKNVSAREAQQQKFRIEHQDRLRQQEERTRVEREARTKFFNE